MSDTQPLYDLAPVLELMLLGLLIALGPRAWVWVPGHCLVAWAWAWAWAWEPGAEAWEPGHCLGRVALIQTGAAGLERPASSGRTEAAGLRAAGLERALKLRVVQTPVGAAAADQLFVSALLNNRAILHHQDQVCLTNS